jgi:hypothetical protein
MRGIEVRAVWLFCFAIATFGCVPTGAWPTRSAPTGTGLEIEIGAPPIAAPPAPAYVPPLLVTIDHEIGRPTEIVGVLDFHSRAEDEDKGFDELRIRAAALGAQAVIDAEFEHGENGGLSHLSGLAVRFR